MRLLAPAKLTRSLRVVGVRPDGYHLVDAEVVALDLADELQLTPGNGGIVIDGPFAAGVPADASNLARRALALTDRTAGLRITKRIPHGGGLGGGSADSAAILRWAGVRDLQLAATLGADVPSCLVGGRVRITGIGDVVEPLPFEPLIVTLVVPPFGISTPAVYRAWDQLGGPTADGPNDLEPAACHVEPRLSGWRDRIAELTGTPPILAGSGSTWYVPGERDDALAGLGSEGAVVIVARSVDRAD